MSPRRPGVGGVQVASTSSPTWLSQSRSPGSPHRWDDGGSRKEEATSVVVQRANRRHALRSGSSSPRSVGHRGAPSALADQCLRPSMGWPPASMSDHSSTPGRRVRRGVLIRVDGVEPQPRACMEDGDNDRLVLDGVDGTGGIDHPSRPARGVERPVPRCRPGADASCVRPRAPTSSRPTSSAGRRSRTRHRRGWLLALSPGILGNDVHHVGRSTCPRHPTESDWW